MRSTRACVLVLAVLLAQAVGNPLRSGAQAPTTVVVAQSQDIDSGDPQKSASVQTWNPLINIYDTLIARDAQLQLKPGLALSWRMASPTVWEFALRRGVRFHDGEPFNAAAVKFSLDRLVDPQTKSPLAGLFRSVTAVTAVDEQTMRITTSAPAPFLPRILAYHAYILPPRYVQKNGDLGLARHPVGTGPYQFVAWVKDDHLEMTANPNYWGGRPRIDHVIVRVVPNEASRLAELLSGSAQLINLVPPEEFGPIQRSPRAKLVSAPSASLYYVLFNLVNIASNRPLADKRVRQALNYAVDRKTIIDTIMRGVGDQFATFCTAAAFGCDASIAPYPYDPDRARVLLKDAGFANGFDMTIATSSGGYPGDRDITLAVADQLGRVGVRAQVVVADLGLILSEATQKKLPQDAWFNRITDVFGYAGRASVTLFHSTRAVVPMWVPGNKQFDGLLDGAETTLDENASKEMYRRAELLFKDEAPAMALFTAPNVYGLSRNLNWTPRMDLWLTMFDASYTTQ